MSPQVRARVFEPFFTTKDLGDGTGLGLAVAYGVIEQHGGLVQVASTPGGGTTFDVYFPASAARSAAPTPVAGIRPLAGGRETILLAEDEELVRRAVVRLLEGAGYRVIAAANGREAVELCRAHETIDLALLDLVMPELGGAEALELIRVEHPGLPAIFVSGYSGRARGSRAIPPDAVIVNKPFELSRLLHAIRAALD